MQRHHVLFAAFAVGGACCATAHAQIVTEIVADTRLIARTAVQSDTKPAGYVLLARGATYPNPGVHVGGSFVCPWHATARATQYLYTGARAELVFENVSSSQGGLCSPVPNIVGPHAVRMHFASRTVTAATLRVSTTAAVAGHSSYTVDVGNDGTIELSSATTTGPGTLEMPVTLVAGQDLVVRVECAASDATMNVDVELIPGTVFPTYGPSCTAELLAYRRTDLPVGPALQLDADRQTVVPGAPAFAAWIFGIRQQNLAIPPTGCALLTDTVVALPTPLLQFGRARTTIPIPAGASGLSMRAQFVTGYPLSGAPVQWYTSNAAIVTLP